MEQILIALGLVLLYALIGIIIVAFIAKYEIRNHKNDNDVVTNCEMTCLWITLFWPFVGFCWLMTSGLQKVAIALTRFLLVCDRKE